MTSDKIGNYVVDFTEDDIFDGFNDNGLFADESELSLENERVTLLDVTNLDNSGINTIRVETDSQVQEENTISLNTAPNFSQNRPEPLNNNFLTETSTNETRKGPGRPKLPRDENGKIIKKKYFK